MRAKWFSCFLLNAKDIDWEKLEKGVLFHLHYLALRGLVIWRPYPNRTSFKSLFCLNFHCKTIESSIQLFSGKNFYTLIYTCSKHYLYIYWSNFLNAQRPEVWFQTTYTSGSYLNLREKFLFDMSTFLMYRFLLDNSPLSPLVVDGTAKAIQPVSPLALWKQN